MKESRNMEEKVSVIIPVYNVEKYLARCLDSVINNTYKNLEILCVNDGSTDNCLEILNLYEKQDCRIKVISKENGGLSSARNVGLENATGQYIAFIDSDDWIHTDYFSLLMNIQKKKNYDVVICNYIRTNSSDAFNGIGILENPIIVELDRKGYMSDGVIKSYVWGKVYKKKCINKLRFAEKEKIEDALYNAMFAQANSELKAAYVNLSLYAYFERGGSLVRQLGTEHVLKLAVKYFEYAQKEKDMQMRDIFLIECIKRSASARYAYCILKDEKESYCNEIANKSLSELKNDKLKFGVIVKFPFVYRCFRIVTDPTMLDWEKRLRRKSKESIKVN